MVLVIAGFAMTSPATAQVVDVIPDDATNPLVVLDGVAQLLPGEKPEVSTTINILIMLTVLSLAPSVLIMCTCFTRMVVVLGLLRQALGTQGLPPSQVVIGLSLFLTAAVMAPTLERTYEEGVKPYADGEITDYNVAWDRSKQPIRDFMFAQIEASGNWSGVYMMLNYRGIDTSDPASLTREDVDMVSLIPAFILSELKVSFLMGFRIYLPFLVIDMVIASLLISMGMLMLPPVLISLPFKLLLFVMVDGWQLVAGSLMTSVVQPELIAVASMMTSGVYFT
jgi:flagellar biosynthetic protein FliP